MYSSHTPAGLRPGSNISITKAKIDMASSRPVDELKDSTQTALAQCWSSSTAAARFSAAEEMIFLLCADQA